MNTQFNNTNNKEIDPTIEYMMSVNRKSKGFTKTMKHAMYGEYVFIKNLIDTLKLLGESQLIKYIVNQQNDEGWTPLMLACRHASTYSNIKTIKLLLDNGADVNLQDTCGTTALIIAAECSNIGSSNEVVKLLLDHGADINLANKIGQTPLMYASVFSNSCSSIETVKILLENGADINAVTSYSNNTLMRTCNHSKNDSHIETIKLLLEYKANVNITDKRGRVAFIHAFDKSSVGQNNGGTLRLLLKHKTDVNLVINKKISINDIIKLLL